MRSRTLHWNGIDMPAALHDLPVGTYVVERVDVAPALTAEEEQGLARALALVDADQTRSLAQVRQTIDSLLQK